MEAIINKYLSNIRLGDSREFKNLQIFPIFSDTGAMKDIHTTKNLETDNVLSSFPLKPGQTGLLAVINGKITGFDIVSLDSVYMNIHNKLLKSYAVQILADSKDRSSGVSKEDALQFIKKAGRTYLEKYKSNGLGWALIFPISVAIFLNSSISSSLFSEVSDLSKEKKFWTDTKSFINYIIHYSSVLSVDKTSSGKNAI